MLRYELMCLVPTTKYAEDELGGVVGRLRDLIAKHGGNITFEDNLGKKRLAYPIRQVHQCYYLLAHFDAEPERIESLKNELKLSSDVVRHLLIKRPGVVRKAAAPPAAAAPTAQIQRDEQAQQKLADLDRKLDELLTKDII